MKPRVEARATASTGDDPHATRSHAVADHDLGDEGEVRVVVSEAVELRAEAGVEADVQVAVHRVLQAEAEHRTDLQIRRVGNLDGEVQVRACRDAQLRRDLQAKRAAERRADEEVGLAAAGVDAHARLDVDFHRDALRPVDDQPVGHAEAETELAVARLLEAVEQLEVDAEVRPVADAVQIGDTYAGPAEIELQSVAARTDRLARDRRPVVSGEALRGGRACDQEDCDQGCLLHLSPRPSRPLMAAMAAFAACAALSTSASL